LIKKLSRAFERRGISFDELLTFEGYWGCLRAAEHLAWADFFGLEVVQALDVFDRCAILVGYLAKAIAAADLVKLALADFLLVGGFDFLKFICIKRDGNISESAFGKVVDCFRIDVHAVVAHFEVQVGAERAT